MIYNCAFLFYVTHFTICFYTLELQSSSKVHLSLILQLCSPKLRCPLVTAPKEKHLLVCNKEFKMEGLDYLWLCLLLLRISGCRLKG